VLTEHVPGHKKTQNMMNSISQLTSNVRCVISFECCES